MTLRPALLLLAALAAAQPASADDPPEVDHQPLPCTVPGRAMAICATVTDDNQVAKSRVYFRAEGERYYSFVEMVFGGINHCGTLPGPAREGKPVEYYVQAMDDQYQAKRTSTYLINVRPEGVCEFPPLEKDAARAGDITVYATHKKQGKKLGDAFVRSGVSFVPIK